MDWLKRWQERNRAKLRQRGFEFAAGALLEQSQKAQQLAEHISCMRDFGAYDEFDKGVQRAIDLYAVREQGKPL